ncbi:Secretory carrier-associated membrane protein [Aphelenchoides fujianensis]|nr:Secretory carrier-associated membrane protein [Aphelenchoides fujianensis]
MLDPSIAQATSTQPAEEYNPFSNQPAAARPVAAPTVGAPQQTSVNMDSELFRQQEELRKREQDLQRRQEEFERRQQQGGGAAGGRGQNPHNWPPLPAFDIDVEIPVQFQETVRLIYNVYLVYVLALTVNVVATFFYMLMAGGGHRHPAAFGHPTRPLHAVRLPLLGSGPVYKAFRDDSSFNFMVFFFVLFLHTIFCFVQALGLSQYACGWSNTISVFSQHIFVGLVMLVSTLAFTAAFGGMAFGLLKVHRLYRGAGFTIDKARKEFSEGVMSDRNVQAAANQATRAAASHAASQFTQGRY